MNPAYFNGYFYALKGNLYFGITAESPSEGEAEDTFDSIVLPSGVPVVKPTKLSVILVEPQEQPFNLDLLEENLRRKSDENFYYLGIIKSKAGALTGDTVDGEFNPDPNFPGDFPRVSTQTLPRSPRTSNSRLLRPTGGRVSSPYGYRIHPVTGKRKMHYGVDLAPGKGKPIYAAESGVVSFSGTARGYGNVIYIEHGGNLQTRYAHCQSLFVSKGQSVRRGDQIATVGSTGLSTGPHLHFEVRVNGKPKDPLSWIQ